MRLNIIRWGGLVGSLLLGVAQILQGDVISGFGVIAAAVSSASIIPGMSQTNQG